MLVATFSFRLVAHTSLTPAKLQRHFAASLQRRSISWLSPMAKRKRTEGEIAPTVAVEVETTAVIISRPKRKRAVKKKEEAWDYPSADDGNESPLTDLEHEESPKRTKRKGSRKKKTDEPVVYDIPPVKHKTTEFQGKSICHVMSGVFVLNDATHQVAWAMPASTLFCVLRSRSPFSVRGHVEKTQYIRTDSILLKTSVSRTPGI